MSLIRYHDTENLTAATTQGDLFNPDQSGLPFAGGGPEPLTCGPDRYGQTIWYDIHPKVPEGLQLTANGVPNVDRGLPLEPDDQQDRRQARLPGGARAAPTRSTSRASCRRAMPTPSRWERSRRRRVPPPESVAFSAAFVPDHDGDGVYDPLDACPTLAGILKLGGCPPVASPSVNWNMAGQMLTEFQVGALPAAARIIVRCSCGISQTKDRGSARRDA